MDCSLFLKFYENSMMATETIEKPYCSLLITLNLFIGARFLKNLRCNPRRNLMLTLWAYVYEQSFRFFKKRPPGSPQGQPGIAISLILDRVGLA